MVRFGRSRPRAVIPLGERMSSGRRDSQLGVLARSLLAAERLGVVIPMTRIVVADVFRHVVQTLLPPGHDPGALVRIIHRPIGVEHAARARERLLSVSLDTELEREIDAAHGELAEVAPWGLAVRASALLADAGTARAAHLAGTELAVTSREELGLAIRRVWALAMSEASLRYLRARRIRDVSIAVVLQPVVAATASVTLVTDARFALPSETPTTAHGTNATRVVVARRGLDDGASDPAEAEILTLDTTGTKQLRAPSQEERLEVRQGRLEWTREPRVASVLAEERIAELGEIAHRLEPLGPSEVRCVIPERGEIHVVDVASFHHGGLAGSGTAQTLWARAAVGESPSGPLTPLSRDVLMTPAFERARRAFEDRAPPSRRLGDVMSLVDGRPYLNISPVFDGDPRSALSDPIGRVETAGAQWSKDLWHANAGGTTLARAGLRMAQIAAEQRALLDEVARFERDAEQQRRWLAEMDLAILPDDALTTTLHEVSHFLNRAHDFYGRASALSVSGHGLLTSVLAAVDAVRAPSLAHAVASGADVATSRPAAAFCHVGAITRLDEAARELIGQGTRRLDEIPDGPARRALGRFLEAYGDRSTTEPELGVPRWGEDSKPVLDMLAAALRGDPVDPDVALSRARALADRKLALLEPSLSFFETRVVRDIVSRQRALLRLRERCRSRVAHGMAMMRTVALDVDRRIRRLDPTLEHGSALMLTLDELGFAVSKYRADLAPNVRARRADLALVKRTPSPPAVFRGAPASPYRARTESVLSGIAASSGAGEGKVVRLGESLEGIERFSPGDVLVVRSLDLGLAPLFVQARAVVSELGTPFSSSAVVARDYGVPVVTGVPFAWTLLREGERVRVDGDGATVECLGG